MIGFPSPRVSKRLVRFSVTCGWFTAVISFGFIACKGKSTERQSTIARTDAGVVSAQTTLPVQATVFADHLGKLYGIAFDRQGNLFAAGTQGDSAVLWKIATPGSAEVFANLRDDVDAMGKIGIVSHSRHLGNLTIDGANSVWITSLQSAAGFLVTQDRKMFKIYLNKDQAVPMKNSTIAPSDCAGVAWDAEADKLYLVTTGFLNGVSGDFGHHLAVISNTSGDYKKFTTPSQKDEFVRLVPDKGTTISSNCVTLIKESGSPLYVVAPKAVLTLGEDGKLSPVGAPLADQTVYAGTYANGAIYLSVEDETHRGRILRIRTTGGTDTFSERAAHPRGLAYRDNSLFVADTEVGEVLRIPVPHD
jgi:sugar lactone lactonase YvrE